MTNLSATEVAKLTATITGGGFKRSANKAEAVARFTKVAAEKGIKPEAIEAILAADGAAQSVMAGYLEAQAAPKVDHSASNKLIADAMAADPDLAAPARRKAALALVEAKAPEAKPARKPRAPKAEKEPRGPTKIDAVVALLKAPDGATMDQITEATGWLPHTARAAISVQIKKKLDLNVIREKAEGRGTVYRVA
jgi:hypothetical protein